MTKKQKDLLERLKEHKPIIVNYGKSIYTEEDVLEPATWDEEKQKYYSETGYWSNELLIEILKGKVENTTLEIYDEE